MGFAIELLLTPLIVELMETKKKSMGQLDWVNQNSLPIE
jgi:hypothetical protein